jgi:hypothetical protein
VFPFRIQVATSPEYSGVRGAKNKNNDLIFKSLFLFDEFQGEKIELHFQKRTPLIQQFFVV